MYVSLLIKKIKKIISNRKILEEARYGIQNGIEKLKLEVIIILYIDDYMINDKRITYLAR